MKLPLLMIVGLAMTVTTLPARADTRRIGAVEFQSCSLGAERRSEAIEAYCTRFEVAENPQQPQGRKLSLNVALVPARSPKPKPDLLVFLAGGPGQAAVQTFERVQPAFEYLSRDRDVLLVDQRGTGGSNRLACPKVDLTDPREQTPEAWARQAQDCLNAVKDRADPRWYTTTDAIRDLESLRAALGSPLYNLVGGSYGTRVALSYLQAHPEGLRSVILDGVVPQDEPLGQSHARNLDDALAKIFAACRADGPCARRFGDPAATLAALRKRLHTAPMHAELPDPLTHARRSETLDEATLAGIVRLYSYEPESAALLPLLIDEAANDRPQPLLAQGLILSKVFDDEFAHGMELSVICTEDAPELHADPADAPRLLGNQLQDLIQAQCPRWPSGTRPPGFKQPVVSDKPVLLLSGEWDPVTPPRFAEAAAKTLSNGRHLIAKGRGHIVMPRGCLPKLAARFVDTLKPAALDASCLDALGNTPAFTSFQGPQP